MAPILIIDDDSAIRKMVATVLAHEGYLTCEASDGAQGLAMARTEHPRLIITDILMPTMDGYELVRHVRSDSILARTPVIFHTAHYLEHEAQELAQSCHVARILTKPCDSTQLLNVVADVLAGAPPADLPSLTTSFSGEHLRLLTDKLAQKVHELQEEIEERKRAQQRVLYLNRVHALLSGINALIVRVAAREELCSEACRLAIEAGGFQIAWIGLKDPDAGRIIPFAWAGEFPDLQRFTQLCAAGNPEQDDVVSQALLCGRAVICNDLTTFTGAIAQREMLLSRGLRALVVLPLVNAHGPVGCVMLASEVQGIFDEEEMRLLADLAGDIAFALDHIEKSETLNYLAYYDSLTGLANRRLFEDRLSQYLETAARNETELALVVMAIEQQEAVSDSLGRQVGDQLLRKIAERFIQSVGNPRTTARLGFDALAAVIPDVRSDGSVIRVVEGWRSKWLGTPFVVEGHELALSVKMGIALYPADGSDAPTLLRNAEAALKKAIDSPERHAFYTQHLDERRTEYLMLESKLRRALEHEQFLLHYQAKVDVESRCLAGVEALLRWQSPELGLVPPARFVPLLEETGLIVEVGSWVLKQASRDRVLWLKRGLAAPRIAVNVSTVQLGRKDFVGGVRDILIGSEGDCGIDVEVTESLIMGDADENIAKLIELRKLGIGIAIDDFGTGYSSLNYLARLPVETLKIDRSFIAAMTEDPSIMTLVSTIVSLAHALKLTVVAEGVESEEQARILRLLRCEQMQGYLIGRPVGFDEMTAWIERQPPRARREAVK